MLESCDGTNYQSGVWHAIWQYSGEPPVKAHSSYRPMMHANVRPKSGERIWLVWSSDPKSEPLSTLNRWRWSLTHFLDRHGWKRAGASIRPKSKGPHVEELVVP